MIFKLNEETKLGGLTKTLTVQHDAHINDRPWIANTTKSNNGDGQPIYRFKDGLSFANTPNPYRGDVVEITPADTFKAGDRAPFAIGVPGAVWGGSKDDILTKGISANGTWTVEFARRLNTGNPDDIKLVPGQAATFVVVVRDDAKGYALSAPVTLNLE